MKFYFMKSARIKFIVAGAKVQPTMEEKTCEGFICEGYILIVFHIFIF